MRFNTALLHQVEKGDKETGATLTPIYHSSAFTSLRQNSMKSCFIIKQTDFLIRELIIRRFWLLKMK